MISVIFFGALEPKGGPSGYLYNLKESIEINGIENIKVFSAPSSNNKSISFFLNFIRKIRSKIRRLMPDYFNEYLDFLFYKKIVFNNINYINSSKIIHLHSTRDFYIFSRLKISKGKILVLTSHSPQLPSEELRENISIRGENSLYKINKKYQRQQKIDNYAFSQADYLIFPNEGAVEPYAEFIKPFNKNIFYVLTATKKLLAKESRTFFRKKLGISEDKIVISYVGRKSLIKGYDIFCDVAKKMEKNDRYLFLSAGVGDIKNPDLRNLIDFGWTDDPGSIIQSSDILIAPNRDTYFDIGIIQALSINKLIITTLTGGNKWFLNKSKKIILIQGFEDYKFVDAIKSINIFEEDRENMILYEENFSNKDFALKYEEIYLKINKFHENK